MEYFFGGADLGTSVDVVLVGDGGVLACSGLDEEVGLVLLGHALDGFGGDGDSGFVLVNFFGDSDHNLLGVDSERIERSGEGAQRAQLSH